MEQTYHQKSIEMALFVLTMYEVDAPPVPVIDIVKKEGFEVMEADFSDLPDPNLSGFISQAGTNKTIYVNRKESFQRKRFTIAREFGHWLLGYINSTEYIRLRGSRLSKMERATQPIEQETDCFAYNLLIPTEFLLNILDAHLGLIDNIRLAELFSVPVHAIKARRDFLGL